MPCQYCGIADHQSRACPWAEMCPICKTKIHIFKYLCKMLKEVRKQEKGYRGYRPDYLSLKLSKTVCQVKDGV